jgi:hypothetical protein
MTEGSQTTTDVQNTLKEAVIAFIDESNVGWDFVYGMVYAEKLYRESNWK